MKAIIYYRKSTDRDDKQANSLEHQLLNCSKTCESYNLEIFKELGESVSAKTERKRPRFQEMIKLCKKGDIDYIVVDRPDRLSRNTLDTAEVQNLMDKFKIKWVLTTGREFLSERSDDKFMLWLNLGISKLDNENRSKSVSTNMLSCIKKYKRFLWKVPFGYKNITIKKWHKDIIVNEEEAQVVREIYELRLENKAYSTIAEILKEKYGNSLNISLQANRMKQLVGKKFYYGVFTWWGEEILWTHTPLVSKETYDKINNVWKWVYEYQTTLKKRERVWWVHLLKWFVRDSSWIKLTACIRKGIEYYMSQYRSDVKVSINSQKLFTKIGDYIKENEGTHELLTSIDRDIILDLLRKDEANQGNTTLGIDTKIENFRNKQERLLDMKLDDVISNETYISKNNEIENQIQNLEAQKISLKNDDFEEKTKIMIELAGSFYQSYFRADNEWKVQIIKKLMIELFVSNKKELRVEDSPLFQSSKMLLNSFGIPSI